MKPATYQPDNLPNAAEAAKQARAVAAAPKYLAPGVVEIILRAIDAGAMSVVLDYSQVGDWSYTQEALRARGYHVKPVQTGMNESGLKVSWRTTSLQPTES